MSNQTEQQMLLRANGFIASHASTVAESKMRQRYHFMGPGGWINDPNGLVFFRGQYHFFYQFNPYEPFWSHMHWGHAVSNDLVHWKHLPIALAPAEEYECHPRGGCFSGSAIEKDGRLYLIYTGTSNHGNGFNQTQCVAWTDDGINFVKYEGNPVLSAPQEVPTDFFRDPKVFEHEGKYFLVCGAQKNGRAQALLYTSQDLLHWEFMNVLFESRGEWGFMWECPDFFPLGDKWVFVCSPMGAGERTCIYFVGDFDAQRGRFYPQTSGEVDWGFDFYAPQSFRAPDNRRIMVGWANGWDWMPTWKDWGPTWRDGWCGAFGVPREVALDEKLHLVSRPIRELASLRDADTKTEIDSLIVESTCEVQVGDGISYDLSFEIDLDSTTTKCVELLLRAKGDLGLLVECDIENAELRLSRDTADGWSAGVSRSPLCLMGKSQLDIRVCVDVCSVELFVDGGRVVHSMNDFAPLENNEIRFQVDDGQLVVKNLVGYSLKAVTDPALTFELH